MNPFEILKQLGVKISDEDWQRLQSHNWKQYYPDHPSLFDYHWACSRCNCGLQVMNCRGNRNKVEGVQSCKQLIMEKALG